MDDPLAPNWTLDPEHAHRRHITLAQPGTGVARSNNLSNRRRPTSSPETASRQRFRQWPMPPALVAEGLGQLGSVCSVQPVELRVCVGDHPGVVEHVGPRVVLAGQPAQHTAQVVVVGLGAGQLA